jgi:hypothetical protein
VVLSDDFNRTGTNWGSNNNGLGGTVTQTYLSVAGVSTNGTQGEIDANRVIVDYNLKNNAAIVTGGGFSVEALISPTDLSTGREWGGIVLSSTNSTTVIGGIGAISNKSNDSVRLGLGVRNSGTLLNRINNSVDFEDPANPNVTQTDDLNDFLFGDGNPDGGINEPIFDQTTYNAYVAATPYTDPFASALSYLLRVDVSLVGGFGQGNQAIASVYVNNVQVDMDLATPGVQSATFLQGWQGDMYLAVLGSGNDNLFDNLKITAIPEPASLALASAGAVALLARRRSA